MESMGSKGKSGSGGGEAGAQHQAGEELGKVRGEGSRAGEKVKP